MAWALVYAVMAVGLVIEGAYALKRGTVYRGKWWSYGLLAMAVVSTLQRVFSADYEIEVRIAGGLVLAACVFCMTVYWRNARLDDDSHSSAEVPR